jgi:hypothetical protein
MSSPKADCEQELDGVKQDYMQLEQQYISEKEDFKAKAAMQNIK